MMDLRSRNFILTSSRQLNVLVDISQPKYNALMRMLAELGSHHAPFVELQLPKAKLLERVAFETVPPKYFDEFIKGQVLDLRQLETVVKTARSRIESDQLWADEESTPEPKLLEEIPYGGLRITEIAPDPVRTIIDMIIGERQILEQMVAQPETTVETIFTGVEQAIANGKLPFFNILIYRPLPDGRWSLVSCTRDWSGARPSKYGGDGAYPCTTLKGVIEGKDEIYEVNIQDVSTFEKAGLIADRASIRNDLKYSKGPGRTLFIKLVSQFGVEAIVQIHNRVGINENLVPPELLPTDEREVRRIKEQLLEYFRTVVRAVELIKGRQQEKRPKPLAVEEVQSEETQRPFSPIQYFGGSTMYRSGRYTTEYNSNPAKNYARIRNEVLRDYDGVVEDVLGERLPRREMEEHTLYVNHSFTDRDREEVTGFATADEHSDYINTHGRLGRLIYYAGIMVKKAHRGGRTAYLTFKMMLKIFKNLGLIKLLFGRTPLIYRTQDRRIHKLGIRYYSAKSDPKDFTEKDWNAIRFAAKKYGWKLEEGTNICRRAYNKRLVDKPEQLLPGLGELDASVCVGSASCRSPLVLLWDVFVKKRVQFNGDKPSVRILA
jgi:hypothetical protein